jgi:hypothetical protein
VLSQEIIIEKPREKVEYAQLRKLEKAVWMWTKDRERIIDRIATSKNN